ncbi:unnamed protein product [Calicophoron daubneyi]|uniref:AH domain-containing protein n=1 Tax=Calicophoron daubneyi TaxID=300641 RepID=A0AAV2T3D3_CALDB
MIKKFGRKQDENIVASDADLDAKLELLKSVQYTCRNLATLLARFQDILCFTSQVENEMGRFLKHYSLDDKTQAGKIMSAVGRVLSHSAQQRLLLRTPLERVQQEVKTFRQRAIADTMGTLKRMETARTEYRGSLLWMKNVSEELDPDTYKQLEKFRCVQAQVRKNKSIFDRLKIDTMQKVDLLSASRCNMLSHVLAAYQNSLLSFLEKTSRTMVAVAERFKGYQYYEFSILKQLRADSRRLAGQSESDGGADDSSSFSVKDENDQSTQSERAPSRSDGTKNQPTQENAPSEEELDKRLDEIFRADDVADVKAEDINIPVADSKDSKQSGDLLGGTEGTIPAEHRDILADLFSHEEPATNPSLSKEKNASALVGPSTGAVASTPQGSSNASWGGDNSFATEWESVFGKQTNVRATAAAPVAGVQPTTDDSSWGEFSTGPSSVLPSKLLEQEFQGGFSLPEQSPSNAARFPFNAAGIPSVPSAAANIPTSSATTNLVRTADVKSANSDNSKREPPALDAWMSLFSDLGPLGNPDTISKKEGQITDA